MPIHGLLITACQQTLAEWIGYDEFLPSNELMTLLAETVCEPWEVTDEICDEILFLLCGADPQELNQVPMCIALYLNILECIDWHLKVF